MLCGLPQRAVSLHGGSQHRLALKGKAENRQSPHPFGVGLFSFHPYTWVSIYAYYYAPTFSGWASTFPIGRPLAHIIAWPLITNGPPKLGSLGIHIHGLGCHIGGIGRPLITDGHPRLGSLGCPHLPKYWSSNCIGYGRPIA